MGDIVNVTIFLVIDLVVLYVAVMVFVIVVIANAPQNGQAMHVTVMLLIIHVLCLIVRKYVLVEANVNVVNVNALKKMA